jgi:nitrous oxidase accessory protein NosD
VIEVTTKRRKLVTIAFLVILFSSTFFVNPAEPSTARQRVIIKSDGTVDPATAPIQRDGETYTFTGNVYAEISVQKSNVVIDGVGFTLQGTYNGTNESAFIIGEGPDQVSNDTKVPYSIGIDLAFPSVVGVTVKNLNIKNFSIGMYIWTTNNTVTGNAITDTIVGVLLSGSDNAITRNYVARNKQGVFFGWTETGNIPLGIEISHNSFESNERHLSGCLCKDYNMTETPHTWDDGKEGNYWSDYNGTDANDDGIGDTSYVIDVLNQDRYPLMNSPVSPPTVAPSVSVEMIWAAMLSLAVVAVIGFRIWKRSSEVI